MRGLLGVLVMMEVVMIIVLAMDSVGDDADGL